MAKKNENKKYAWFVFPLIFLAIVGIAFLVLSLWQVTYVVKDCEIVQEPYTIQECYTIQEPYQVNEPYTVSKRLEYIVLEHKRHNYFWTSGVDVWVIVQNIDDAGGYFDVDFDVTTSRGTYETTSNKFFLASGNNHKFLVSFEGDYKSSTYEVNPPSKKVTEWRTLTKYRPVTKCNNVRKLREVTKCKDVTKYCSALNKLFGGC